MVLEGPQFTPVPEFALAIRRDIDVAFDFSTPRGLNRRGQRVLGACYFAPRPAIRIDPSLPVDSPRFRFVLAHELGHLSLHRRLDLHFRH